MTPLMTPREKVEREVLDAVFSGFEHGQCEKEWEPDYGKEITSKATDAILTALASGSGDHAELARLAETNKAYGFLVSVQPEIVLSLIAENAALRDKTKNLGLAVLSWSETATEQLEHRDEAERKLVEAEEESCRWAFRFAEVREAAGIGVKPMLSEVPGELRKMRSLIDRAADLMRQCTDPERFEGASTLNVYANMRAWLSDLSKEAERG